MKIYRVKKFLVLFQHEYFYKETHFIDCFIFIYMKRNYLCIFALLFMSCSDNSSNVPEYDGPYTVTLLNETKNTAFIVRFISENADTTISYVNPGKSNSIDLDNVTTKIEFTSGIKFTIYATYDKRIVSDTKLIISDAEGDKYKISKKD